MKAAHGAHTLSPQEISELRADLLGDGGIYSPDGNVKERGRRNRQGRRAAFEVGGRGEQVYKTLQFVLGGSDLEGPTAKGPDVTKANTREASSCEAEALHLALKSSYEGLRGWNYCGLRRLEGLKELCSRSCLAGRRISSRRAASYEV